MSPRCRYFSALQNANRRTSQQRRKLSEKRRKDQPMFTNTYDLALEFVNDSTCVLAEQPKSASSWRRTKWRSMHMVCPYKCSVLGCQVGLRSGITGQLLSKAWTFVSDQPALHDIFDPLSMCNCPEDILPHETCQGANTKPTEVYPLPLCRAIVRMARKVAEDRIPGSSHRRQNCRLASHTRSWKKHNAESHWAKSQAAVAIRQECRAAALQARPKTQAAKRKLCKRLASSCRGGLSVAPQSAEKKLRDALIADFGKVRVYCRHCLGVYGKREESS